MSGDDLPQLDTRHAHPARVYNYWLGGKDNFAADREAAEQAIAANPGIKTDVRANRAFLTRVVRYLAGECGVRQFLDIGTGLPVAGNTHQVAQEVAPDARVVYADNDPIVLLHARALLSSTPQGTCDYVEADLRDTAAIVRAAARTLDLGAPVALKIAEEYALLDCVSGGRLIAGFPVGLSYDANLNASLPAVETRERYREHRELILKAWSEPRPFPWNGRFEKYGQVNIWPRPVQQPHPPIWIPGTGSPGTLRDILSQDYVFVYLSWDGPKLTGRQVFDRYWELADELGRDRNPYRLAFLQVVAVSETDERAEREYARHLEAHYRSGLGAIPHTAMAVPGYAEPAAIEGMLRSTGPAGMLSRMKTATYAEIVDSQVAIVGSPATVADQIEAFVREFRIGNLMVMLQNGSMPRDLTEKNISLFAAEVLPRLRPVWDAEGWENHWWPRAAAIEGAL